MRIISPHVEIIDYRPAEELYKKIEIAGRTCYKSEDKITPESSMAFVKGLIKRGHHAMLEHASITCRFTCDRGVSHEIVRHRIAAYAQESTRYCNYTGEKFDKEITVIKPIFFEEGTQAYISWAKAMENAEKAYISLIDCGATPQEARSVLPNSLKTEIVVTMDIREWMHFFDLRYFGVTGAPHPQMREAAGLAYDLLSGHYPAFFVYD